MGFLVKEAVELLDFGSLMALKGQAAEEVPVVQLAGRLLVLLKTQVQVAIMVEVLRVADMCM